MILLLWSSCTLAQWPDVWVEGIPGSVLGVPSWLGAEHLVLLPKGNSLLAKRLMDNDITALIREVGSDEIRVVYGDGSEKYLPSPSLPEPTPTGIANIDAHPASRLLTAQAVEQLIATLVTDIRPTPALSLPSTEVDTSSLAVPDRESDTWLSKIESTSSEQFPDPTPTLAAYTSVSPDDHSGRYRLAMRGSHDLEVSFEIEPSSAQAVSFSVETVGASNGSGSDSIEKTEQQPTETVTATADSSQPEASPGSSGQKVTAEKTDSTESEVSGAAKPKRSKWDLWDKDADGQPVDVFTVLNDWEISAVVRGKQVTLTMPKDRTADSDIRIFAQQIMRVIRENEKWLKIEEAELQKKLQKTGTQIEIPDQASYEVSKWRDSHVEQGTITKEEGRDIYFIASLRKKLDNLQQGTDEFSWCRTCKVWFIKGLPCRPNSKRGIPESLEVPDPILPESMDQYRALKSRTDLQPYEQRLLDWMEEFVVGFHERGLSFKVHKEWMRRSFTPNYLTQCACQCSVSFMCEEPLDPDLTPEKFYELTGGYHWQQTIPVPPGSGRLPGFTAGGAVKHD